MKMDLNELEKKINELKKVITALIQLALEVGTLGTIVVTMSYGIVSLIQKFFF